MHGERRQSDADAAAAVCERRTRETCVRARYRTIYGRHDIVRWMNLRSISRYRVIDMITKPSPTLISHSSLTNCRFQLYAKLSVSFHLPLKFTIQTSDKVTCNKNAITIFNRDVKRLSVYRLSFIFLVLVFEFQKSIIVSNLGLSS